MITINIDGNSNHVSVDTAPVSRTEQPLIAGGRRLVDENRFVCLVDDELTIVRRVETGRGLRAFDESIHRFIKLNSFEIIRGAFVGETYSEIVEDGPVAVALYGEEEDDTEIVDGYLECEDEIVDDTEEENLYDDVIDYGDFNDDSETAEVATAVDCEVEMMKMILDSRGREIEDLKVQVATLAAIVDRLVGPTIKHVAIDSVAGC
tara:strand:+ start:1163 stop:1780 length:618 start_codon:yes stop_codon:yes gene_type:complete